MKKLILLLILTILLPSCYALSYKIGRDCENYKGDKECSRFHNGEFIWEEEKWVKVGE